MGLYLNSERYPISKDHSGNMNNVYDPKRIQQAKKAKGRPIQRASEPVPPPAFEELTVWNAKINGNMSPQVKHELNPQSSSIAP
jgi:hypothetical protein